MIMQSGVWIVREGRNNLENNLQQKLENFMQRIKKVRWENEQIAAEFGQRSLQSVWESWEVFYMGSCIEMVPLFLLELQKEHPDPSKLTLGCEIIQWKANNQLSIHFFIKDESVIPNKIIDFIRDNEISVYSWEYQNPRNTTDLDSLASLTLSAEKLQNSDTLLTLAEKLQLPLGIDDLKKMIARYQKANTPEEFADYTQRSPLKIRFVSESTQAKKKEKLSDEVSWYLTQML